MVRKIVNPGVALAALAGLAAFAAAPAHAQVVDGSFESPVVSTGVTEEANIDGVWFADAGTISLHHLDLTPDDGDQFVELKKSQTISQTVSLGAGTFDLSFSLSAYPGFQGFVGVFFNGVKLSLETLG